MSISVDTGVSTGGNPAGNRVWWQNSDPVDKTHGILPTPLDVGTSCFYSHVNTEFLLTVHSGNPELRRDGTVNDHDEAYSVGLGEPLVRNWVDNVMFGAAEEAVALSSKVATCSIEPGTVELFGIEANGKIAWWRWNEAWHHEATIEPPEGVALARDKLGVLCTRRGTIGLFARSTDGEIWQQVGEPLAGSPGEWLPVLDASTPITSGIGVVGLSLDHFHVFARGESGELRHAEYKNGWTGKWADLGGALVGTPAAAMWYEGRINLFVRWEDDSIYEGWFYDGVWRGWVAHGATVTSDPVVTSWGDDRLDVLVRSAHGTMLHLWYDAWWVDPWIDTGIPMPEGSPAMLSWERGRLDLFVGQGESSVWRAVWPRLPSPQTGMRKRAE